MRKNEEKFDAKRYFEAAIRYLTPQRKPKRPGFTDPHRQIAYINASDADYDSYFLMCLAMMLIHIKHYVDVCGFFSPEVVKDIDRRLMYCCNALATDEEIKKSWLKENDNGAFVFYFFNDEDTINKIRDGFLDRVLKAIKDMSNSDVFSDIMQYIANKVKGIHDLGESKNKVVEWLETGWKKNE